MKQSWKNQVCFFKRTKSCVTVYHQLLNCMFWWLVTKILSKNFKLNLKIESTVDQYLKGVNKCWVFVISKFKKFSLLNPKQVALYCIFASSSDDTSVWYKRWVPLSSESKLEHTHIYVGLYVVVRKLLDIILFPSLPYHNHHNLISNPNYILPLTVKSSLNPPASLWHCSDWLKCPHNHGCVHTASERPVRTLAFCLTCYTETVH